VARNCSAIKTGYEVHDAQMEVCTLAMLDKALDTIAATLKQKKGKIINA
jgi:hypothetical protein